MYLNFFRLEREPFQVTPDPDFFYFFPSHREAVAALLYGVQQRKGVVTVTGEVGAGKTTILRVFLERINRERTKVISLVNANVSFDDFLTTLLTEFGVVPNKDESTFVMVGKVHGILLEYFRQDRNVVLIVDEAQNMPAETMEGLRVLSNLETETDKLLQIVFCGQPELDEKLARPELRYLKQRIAVRAKVVPLTHKEGARYIQHRLAMAGIRDAGVFTGGAIRQIVSAAQGIPRVINILSDNALATAMGYQERRVTRKVAKEIISDHNATYRLKPARRWIKTVAVGASTAAVFGAGLLFLGASGRVGLVGTALQSPERAQVLLQAPQSIPKGVPEPPPRPPAMAPAAADVAAAGDEDRVAEKIEAQAQAKVKTPSASSAGEKDGAANAKPTGAATHGHESPTSAPPTEPKADNAQELAAQRPPPLKRNAREPVTRTVRPGDSLYALVAEVYGAPDQRLIELVRQHNPQIEDIRLIHIGDLLTFPSSAHMVQ